MLKTPIAIGMTVSALLASPVFAQSLESSMAWTSGTGANGHTYRLYSSVAGIRWAESESFAVAQGGHLVSITSAEENAFVYDSLGVGTNANVWYYYGPLIIMIGPWIGGFQPTGAPEPSGGFEWTDGSPWGYTNWASNEPNNASPGEQTVHFFRANGNTPAPLWNDYPGEIPIFGFVVEMPHACTADTNGDHNVNVADLLAVITNWGTGFGTADINGDGTVNVADLLGVITAWGACP